VIAEVPEAQAGLVVAGVPVEVRAATAPDRVLRGTVQALLPDVNAATRTVRARIVLANPGGALKPGMYATVAFAGAKSATSVLVPSEAVIRTGTRDVVIVVSGEGRYAPVDVEVGRESGDLTEIRRGVAAGTHVVASGQFLIDSEASLRGVLARMNTGAAPSGDPHAGHRAAPAAPPAVSHRATGVVRDVDGADVFIQHGPIEVPAWAVHDDGVQGAGAGCPPT
jgi:Cu(I)/Ag(I) efflux system membrane fusion protein